MFELLSAGYKTERGFMKKGEIYEGIIENNLFRVYYRLWKNVERDIMVKTASWM